LPKAKRLKSLLVAVTLFLGGCSYGPSLVQVECEANLQGRSSSTEYSYYEVRRAKYWSDGSTTYEPIHNGIDVLEGGWQFVYRRPGEDPCW